MKSLNKVPVVVEVAVVLALFLYLRKFLKGAGLILAALVFGLFHPLTVTDGTSWAWALWTTAGGLIFGFLRENAGTFFAPAMLHATTILPTAFLAPGLTVSSKRSRRLCA